MNDTYFDAFLCHNGADKAEVEDIARRLEAEGLVLWLDRYELRPGTPWKRFVKKDVDRIAALVVFLGGHPYSPGQAFELKELVPLMQRREVPVVPVILKSYGDGEFVLPEQLEDHIAVDFRKDDQDPVKLLIWGVKGETPYRGETVAAYYKELEGLSAEALPEGLAALLKRATRVVPYRRNTRIIAELFRDPADDSHVIGFYDRAPMPANGRRLWHKDHIWPQAFGFRQRDPMASDLHNIVAAEPNRNVQRGAGLFYDEFLDQAAPKDYALAPTKDEDARGAVARACLYMAARYVGGDGEPDLYITESDVQPVVGEPHIAALRTLLYWHRMIPVSNEERARNQAIQQHQGNRNPFVDRPDLAWQLWYPV